MQSSQGRSRPNTRVSEIQYVIVSRDDSSSATTSNLPGPSRVMGKVFSFLGAKLERRINLFADRLGYGPLALRRKLSKEYDGLRWAMKKIPVEERKRMIRKLMRYVSCGTSITQSQALELICDLILQDRNFAIRDEFMDAGLYAELQDLWIYCNMARKQYRYLSRRDPDIDLLLASSRKALIFVEENEVNTVAKPFLSLDRREIRGKPYPDRLVMLSTLLHAFTVLLHQSYLKETRNTPIGTLASTYWRRIDLTPWFILRSFYEGGLRSESLVIPLPTEKIELCIRAYFLSFFPLVPTDRILVRHYVFKLLTEERRLRYYSLVQRTFADYNQPQEPDIWDDTPLLPDRYSNVEMEPISATKVPVDQSKLDELRFSLPTGLDNATLRHSSFDLKFSNVLKLYTVWEISSDL